MAIEEEKQEALVDFVEQSNKKENQGPISWQWIKHPAEEMTTRDWFAGQALTILDAGCHDAWELASTAYAIADAMLEARKK